MVDWSLAGSGNSFTNAFAQGAQIGKAIRERKAENALSAYVSNQAQAQAPGYVATPEQQARSQQLEQQFAKTNPRAYMQMQGQRQQQEAQSQQQRRADIPLLSRLVEGSTDEATYQRNRQLAQQYGVDTSGLPQQFDPAWRDQTLSTLKQLQTPQGQEALSTAGKIAADEGLRPGTPEFGQRVSQIWASENQKTIPYTAGGGVAQYDPSTGQVRSLIVPNTTGAPAGTPVRQGAQSEIPRLTNPSEVSRLQPGQQFYDPNGVLRQVPGGPSQPATGGFR